MEPWGEGSKKSRQFYRGEAGGKLVVLPRLCSVRRKEKGAGLGLPALGHTVAVVVGGRGISQDGDETCLCGARGGHLGERGVAAEGRVRVARSVQILVELIAIHVPQQFRLTQLIQRIETRVFRRRGELAQVGMEVGVERMVGGRGVISGRWGTARDGGHHGDSWGLAKGQGAQGVTAVQGARGEFGW